jgi:valyl-tRNA synthetase
VIGRDGRFQRETPEWIDGDGGTAYDALAGKTVFSAREAMVQLPPRLRRPRR